MPIHQRCRAPDRLDAARIGQSTQPEFDRVEPGRRREFVGETLDGKAIGRLSRRADWRRPQRRIFEPMGQHLHIVRRIGRIGILRDHSGLQAAHVVEPGGGGTEQWNIR